MVKAKGKLLYAEKEGNQLAVDVKIGDKVYGGYLPYFGKYSAYKKNVSV